MGLFKKRTDDPAEIERLKAEIAAMGARLQASESAKDDLDHRVAGITERLERSTPPPPAPPRPTVDPADIDKINAHIARLNGRLDDRSTDDRSNAELTDRIDEQMRRITDRIDELDQRITSIAAELANQIDELGGELDAVAGDAPPTGQVVGELREAQTQLANEQARYQIAFRQDLAELADRLKRA